MYDEKENQKKQNKKKQEKRKQLKLQIIKEHGGCCEVCKIDFDPCVYEFHHIDATIKDEQPAFIFRSYLHLKKLREKLKGCMLICANCHKIIHKNQNLKNIKCNNKRTANIQISFHF